MMTFFQSSFSTPIVNSSSKDELVIVPSPTTTREGSVVKSNTILKGRARGKRYGGKSDSSKGKLFSINTPPLFKKVIVTNIFKGVWSIENSAWLGNSSIVEQGNELVVAASLISDIGSLINVFDQYRITFIEVAMFPRCAPGSSPGVNLGSLITVIDYDDSVPLASTTVALDYSNVLFAPVGDGHYRTYKPRANLLVGVSGLSAAGTSDQWIDCNSVGIEHYGMKAIMTTCGAGVTTSYDQLVRIHAEFRCQR